jgi:hypothetical protein
MKRRKVVLDLSILELPLEIMTMICRLVVRVPDGENRCVSALHTPQFWNFAAVCKEWLEIACFHSRIVPVGVIRISPKYNSENAIVAWEDQYFRSSPLKVPVTITQLRITFTRVYMQCLNERLSSHHAIIRVLGSKCHKCDKLQIRGEGLQHHPIYSTWHFVIVDDVTYAGYRNILCWECAVLIWNRVKLPRIKRILYGESEDPMEVQVKIGLPLIAIR